MLGREFSALSFALTLALHALVVAALLWLPPAVKLPPTPQVQDEPIFLIRAYAEGEPDPPERRAGNEGPAITEDPCGGDFYVGIGIVSGGLSGLVIFVAPGAPADRAGIRHGEQILNAEMLGANRYHEGTELELHVESTSGHRRWVVLRVEKICNA
ncbi:MAG: hypothetical protein AB1430_01980 [Pseudomonadota bacterium]